jgi:2',3'-cyclic-nucleotide 2'-phosphodiesterase / 3'-nucleotidase
MRGMSKTLQKSHPRVRRFDIGRASLFGVCLALAWLAAPAQAQQLRLRLLGTTDIHVHLLGHDYYQDKSSEEFGLVRTAALINAARAEAPNNLLFDNGDLLQGNPLGDYIARVKPLQAGQVHPVYKVMNALRYDAANIGNHEFNYGLPFLKQALLGAAFPYVNANIVVDDGKAVVTSVAVASAASSAIGSKSAVDAQRNVFMPYVLLQRRFKDDSGAEHSLRIGVIGFVPPQVMQWDRQHLQGQVQARDIVRTAREWVPRIKAAGADIVVAIPHSGFERGETVLFAENTVARLAEVPGIDAILFGHSHGEFPGRFFSGHPKVDLARGTINGVPAAMPGAWGSHLAVMDLVLNKDGDSWKVTDGRAELRAVFDRSARKALVQPDATLAALLQAEHEGTRAYLQSPVANSAAPIHSYFAQVADDPSVQLVSLAQLAYAKRALVGTPYEKLPILSAAAPFKSGGRQGNSNYNDIPAGALTVRHVADLYVYPNTVHVVRLTGAQVREWLEMSAGAFNRINPQGPAEQDLVNTSFPSFNFDTLDGLTYSIDVTQAARYDRSGQLVAPEARRISQLRHQAQAVADDAVFLVVTNNYRASGGGNFPALNGANTVLQAPDENREALLQYLKAAQRVDASADNNWAVLPVPGVKLRFTSGAGGITHLKRYPNITLVKDNGDGSALYELAP